MNDRLRQDLLYMITVFHNHEFQLLVCCFEFVRVVDVSPYSGPSVELNTTDAGDRWL